MALTICAKCKRPWQAYSGTEPCPWCRAEAAEAKLQATEVALRHCQSLFQNIHDYGAMGNPNDWLKVQAVWDMVNAALSTAPTLQPKVRVA